MYPNPKITHYFLYLHYSIDRFCEINLELNFYFEASNQGTVSPPEEIKHTNLNNERVTQ